MKYFWDIVDEMIQSVHEVGSGTIDGKPVTAIRFGEFTEWVSPDSLFDTITPELLAKKEAAIRRAELAVTQTKRENTNFIKRDSLAKCPACGNGLTDILQPIKGQKPRLKKTVCDKCGYNN